jgi:predicted dehydrogenase
VEKIQILLFILHRLTTLVIKQNIMDQIRWGIIGCGDVTELKSGPAFNKVPNSKLVAVMRRSAAKAEDYARRHKVPKWYSDAQQLIEDPEVNAIYIATPPQSHEEYTLKAFAAGKPVYVEKPMALNCRSAERMLQASLDNKIKLTIAHYRREQPRFKTIKSMLEEKVIGEVRLVNLRLYQPPLSSLHIQTEVPWRIDPSVSGGGLFHDLSPHQLDLIQYFFGLYEKASGFSMNQAGLYQADDLVAGNIVFKNGMVFNGAWCFTASKSGQADWVEIIGSEGTIAFTTFTTHHFILHKNGREEVFQFDELEHVQQPMIEAVVKYFLDKRDNPCSAHSGVETMHIIDAFTKKN